MTKADFIHILENPYRIEDQHLNDLEAISHEFPYFQAANAILLKAFKNTGNYRYTDLLKKVAAQTSDRSILFEYITQIEFSQEFAVNEIKYLDSTADANAVENEPLEQENLVKEDVVKPSLISPDKSNSSKELNFEQWIEVLTKGIQIIDSKEDKSLVSNEIIAKFDRIDKFLNEKPKIIPSRTNDINIDIAKQSVTENDSVMTETLAKIYIKQKKYSRAIKAYRILSLKYPEKSGYFANQIRAIKKIE